MRNRSQNGNDDMDKIKEFIDELRSNCKKLDKDHKLASVTISASIKLLPPPFNILTESLWDSLKHDSEPASKFLEAIENMHKNMAIMFKDVNVNIDKSRSSIVEQNELHHSEIMSELKIIKSRHDDADNCYYKSALLRTEKKLMSVIDDNYDTTIQNAILLWNNKQKGYVQSLQKSIEINPKRAEAYFCIASILGIEGNDVDAIKYFKMAEKRNMVSFALFHNMGIALYHLGYLEESSKYLKKAISEDAQQIRTYVSLSNVLIDMKKFPDSLEYLNTGIKIDADNTDLHFQFGLTFYMLGQYNNALLHFEKYICDDGYGRFYYAAGLTKTRMLDFESASKYMKKSIELGFTTVSIYTDLAFALSNSKNKSEAIYYCDKAISIEPENIELYNKKGIIFGILGHDENALECFENVLDKDPKNITAHILKSEALFMLQRVDDALLFFEKAAISNPNNLTVYFRMGVILMRLNRLPDAVVQFKKAIEINPNSHESYYFLGLIMYKRAKYNDAIPYFKHAVSLCQKSDYFNEIGNSLMYLHKYDEAITFFNKSITLDSSCTAYINKCMSLHTLKKYPEVIACFKIAITKCQNVILYEIYADSLLLSSNTNANDILEIINIILRLNFENGRWHYNKGILLFNQQEYDESLKCFIFSAKYDYRSVNSYKNIGFIYNKKKLYHVGEFYLAKSKIIAQLENFEKTLKKAV